MCFLADAATADAAHAYADAESTYFVFIPVSLSLALLFILVGSIPADYIWLLWVTSLSIIPIFSICLSPETQSSLEELTPTYTNTHPHF